MYGYSQKLGLLSDFPQKAAGSTESHDSGLGVDDCRSPFIIPAAEAAAHHASVASLYDNVFPPSPSTDERPNMMSGNDFYIGLDDVVTMPPTLTPVRSSAGYVTAWIDVENKAVIPLRSVDAHLLPHIKVVGPQHDAELFTAPTPGNHASSNDDTASLSTRQDFTTDTVLSDEVHGSADRVASTIATNQLDAAQPHNTAPQSNAVHTEDSSILPYITL